MAFWSEGVEVGINVFLYTNNTVSNFQPPYWEPFTNADGTVFPGVKKVWYGGHKNLITDAEAVILTAAGYGADITYDAIYDSSTYDSTDTLA